MNYEGESDDKKLICLLLAAALLLSATCTETGLTEGKHCSVCSTVLVKQEEVAALGHTEVTDAAVAPTCTETGLTEGKHCSVCNTVLVAQTEIPTTAHGFNYLGECLDCGFQCPHPNGVSTAEYYSDTEHSGLCDVCKGYAHLPHTFSHCVCTLCGFEKHTPETVEAVDPTCTVRGYTAGTRCSVCQKVLNGIERIPPLGCDFECVGYTFLMVDEAHSTCVIGETGGGVDEYYGLKGDDIDIKMGTLSKGLGACGGYIAGSHNMIEYMRYNLPGFVFSVGISPALAAAVLCSVRLMQTDRTIMADMRRNVQCFADECHKRGLDIGLAGKTAILPVLVGPDADAWALSNLLRHKGVFVPPAVYPAVPRDQARLRFCVTSVHKPEQIIEALDKLEEAANELGIVLPRV